MKAYTITYFEQVKVSRKEETRVQANSKEEAIVKFENDDYEWWDGETLHDTAELIEGSREIEEVFEN